MVRTFTGPNGFALKQAVNKIKSDFTGEYGDLAVEIIDGDEAEFIHIKSALESVPFLASKKLVIVQNLGAVKEAVERIEELTESANETTELIIVESKPDKRGSYYKYLKKHTDLTEFKELDDRELANWLTGEAKKMDAQLNSADAYYLVQRVGNNQRLIYRELQKLVNYNSRISRQTIDLLTEASPQTSIFNLLDSAFAGEKQKTIQLYEEQRLQKVEPLNILGMIIWQMHSVALLDAAGERSDAEIMQVSGLKPFTLNKSRSIARRLGSNKVKTTLNKLSELDKQLKTTAVDPDEALKNFLISL